MLSDAERMDWEKKIRLVDNVKHCSHDEKNRWHEALLICHIAIGWQKTQYHNF